VLSPVEVILEVSDSEDTGNNRLRERELTIAWWESQPMLTGGASLPAFFPSVLASLVDMYKLDE
jgi:hypothetical protein